MTCCKIFEDSDIREVTHDRPTLSVDGALSSEQ